MTSEINNRIVEVPLSDIIVGDRHRKDFGDLEALARSIAEVGLLQPIGITPEAKLVFGERRLRACRDILNRETILARIVDVRSILDGEIDENCCRKPFTISEMVAVVDTLRSYSYGGDRRSDQVRSSDVERLTLGDAAKRVGLGNKDTYYRAKKVVESGVNEVVEAMDLGDLSVMAAAKLVEQKPEIQRSMLAERTDWTVPQIMASVQRKDARPAATAHGIVPAAEVVGPLRINTVTAGDCWDLIPLLPEKSVNLVPTSPPYAKQRDGFYPSVPEAEYPEFTVGWMDRLIPKLADDASVLIVIRPHLHDGVLADYVLRTELALREAGWSECEEIIWRKRDAGACMGNPDRPRRTFEKILWFSRTNRPFARIKECGQVSTKVSFNAGPKAIRGAGKAVVRQPQDRRTGRTKLTDVIDVPVATIEKGIDHPAKFPVPLAEILIKTFCPEGGTVLDPFAGSGSALVAAQNCGRSFYGFDIVPEYCNIARERLGQKVAQSSMLPSRISSTETAEASERRRPKWPAAG